MARIVPSHIVGFIERAFPWVTDRPSMTLGVNTRPTVAALIRLIDSIPPELVIIEGDDLVSFSVSLEVLRDSVAAWATLERQFLLGPIIDGVSPVAFLHRMLKGCPDEFPSSETGGLLFLGDAHLRNSLRMDIDVAGRALSNAEWKAATVLAGSVVEALLLWSIERRSAVDIEGLKSISRGRAASPPNQWSLHEYVQAARELGHIEESTATLADLAKDFRNLIHPGREARTGARCDRGTALAAVATVEHVVRDLERWATVADGSK